MKTLFLSLALVSCGAVRSQKEPTTYKKRVLESTELEFLGSYYSQDGGNASVTGGIGTEQLTDYTPTIVISIPINADDVLTMDIGISTYTSASSSNGNPFDITGASGNGNGEDDEDDDKGYNRAAGAVIGSPWVASTGASRQDTWVGGTVDYSHSSNSRNTIYNLDASFANEYDYSSFGVGAGITQLFNEKNTTLGLSGKVYLDKWRPVYPTELKSYEEVDGHLNTGFFTDVSIYDENGLHSNAWKPLNGFPLIENTSRNSYSLSLSVSQILSKNAQISLFVDLLQQKGWLANPLQRVYFADKPNFYIGNIASIPNYTSPSNTDVFQLADDIERLPSSRFKIPIGLRFNYYINEIFVVRTYYRYYFDDWGVSSHTASLEIPIKLGSSFTIYPSYRYYQQTQADYFAPFDQNLSTAEFYTSDYDLSKFTSNQYGLGLGYTDILTKFHLFGAGLKSIDIKYSIYRRNTGLRAFIVSGGFKFVL